MIEATVTFLSLYPWLGICAAFCGFVSALAATAVLARRAASHPESPRKFLHVSSGLLTLAFPFVFSDVWPVLVLTVAAAVILMAVKILPRARRHFGCVSGVERTTLGELYFPVSVAIVFCLSNGASRLLFVIPVLVLTIADAAAAVIGIRYGAARYAGGTKTVEGSLAFAVVAFVCIHVPLVLWSALSPADSVLVAATSCLVLTLLERCARCGRDNLFIPIGSYFLLRGLSQLDTAALVLLLAVTVAVTGIGFVCVSTRHCRITAAFAGIAANRGTARGPASWRA